MGLLTAVVAEWRMAAAKQLSILQLPSVPCPGRL